MFFAFVTIPTVHSHSLIHLSIHPTRTLAHATTCHATLFTPPSSRCLRSRTVFYMYCPHNHQSLLDFAVRNPVIFTTALERLTHSEFVTASIRFRVQFKSRVGAGVRVFVCFLSAFVAIYYSTVSSVHHEQLQTMNHPSDFCFDDGVIKSDGSCSGIRRLLWTEFSASRDGSCTCPIGIYCTVLFLIVSSYLVPLCRSFTVLSRCTVQDSRFSLHLSCLIIALSTFHV